MEYPWTDEIAQDEFERRFESIADDQSSDESLSGIEESLASEWLESGSIDFEARRQAEWSSARPETHMLHSRRVNATQSLNSTSEVSLEQEVVLGTMLTTTIPMAAADPPCRVDSPLIAASTGRPVTGRNRIPDWQPGAGRLRRHASREYVQWVQHLLNRILGTGLALDGVWGPRISMALREFQKRNRITTDGKIGPETEGALRRASGTEPPQREVEDEGVVAGLGLALNFVKFGFETISKLAAGDLLLYAPQVPVGIKAENVPSTFLRKPRQHSILITNFIEKSPIGVEQVNVKLRCSVSYNGLELAARFSFDPQGERSRLGRNTVIKIDDPIEMHTEIAPLEWQRCNVADYRILRIPVSFRIDRPWPLDNYNENFELVLSTMYGFGAKASGPQRAHIQHQRVEWN